MKKLMKYLGMSFEKAEKHITDYLTKRRLTTTNEWGTPLSDILDRANQSIDSHVSKLFGTTSPEIKKAFSKLSVYDVVDEAGETITQVQKYEAAGITRFRQLQDTPSSIQHLGWLRGNIWGTGLQFLTSAQARSGLGLGTLASLDAVGTNQINNKAVTLAKFQDVAAYSIVGRIGDTEGVIAVITADANGVLRRSGSGDLVFGTLVTGNIGDSQITHVKYQNIDSQRIIGRISAGSGVVEELTGGNVRTIADVYSKTEGDNRYGRLSFENIWLENQTFNKDITVKGTALFKELIIDQLSVVAGSQLLSYARGKIASVDAGANQITLEDPNDRNTTSFIVDDFFWVAAVDIEGTTLKNVKGQITAITDTTLTLNTGVTGGTGAVSDLDPGDVIVQRGHPTDTERQNLIYKTVSDADAPVEKYLTGIDSLAAFDNPDNVSVQIGNIEGVANAEGHGFYGSNQFLTGKVVIGDLSKTDNYMSFDNDELDIKTNSFLMRATRYDGSTPQERAVISSLDRTIYFEKLVNEEMVRVAEFKANPVTPLATFISPGTDTITPLVYGSYDMVALEQMISDELLSETFDFLQKYTSLQPRIRVVYTPDVAADAVNAYISIKAELVNTANTSVYANFGTINHNFDSGETIQFEYDRYNAYFGMYGDRKIRYTISGYDYSIEESTFEDKPGDFIVGGNGNNETYHRVKLVEGGEYKTEVGSDGLGSVWDALNYFYYTSGEGLNQKGDIIISEPDYHSDEKNKENIERVTPKNIEAEYIQYNERGKKAYGISAQKLEKIAPELVSNRSLGKGIKYNSFFIMKLAYLEQTKIPELEAKNKELEDRIEKLEELIKDETKR